MSNVIMDSEQGASKKQKNHEARMIPGVDGDKIFGFPNSIITKIRYCDNYVLDLTSGATNKVVFAANGIYDPDITNTGHQPMFRDNYAAIYDQYVVIGSKISVDFGTLSTFPCVCGIIGDDDSTMTTNVQTAQEINNSVSTLVGAWGSSTKRLVSTFEPLEMFGVDAKADGSSQTAVGSNPSELWCYGVWAAAPDGTTTARMAFRVEIEYTVKFSELITQVQN